MTSITDKTVLITGGTGSFGKTVAKRLLDDDAVQRIVIFSRDEKKQHELRLSFNDPRLHFEIGDVRDERRVMRAMRAVDLVFHAAALKHVPACEFYPMEAVKTNIIGTDNVIDAAIANNVSKVVVLSTDKAAYPINAMGCSKMMMEKIMIARALKSENNTNTILCGVRYGNVLFSRGSVLPLFFNQLQNNQPMTITNPAMTRFLMPLSEAVNLVMHSLKEGQNGDIFIHKAKASSIENVAHACAKLTGKTAKTKIIGVRGGEKQHETLATFEELCRAEDQGDFWRIPSEHGQNFDKFLSEGNIRSINQAGYDSHNAAQLDVDQIINMIQALPEYQSLQSGQRDDID